MSKSNDLVTFDLQKYFHLILEGSIDVSFAARDIPLSCVFSTMTAELNK